MRGEKEKEKGKFKKTHTLDKQSVSLCKHWSSPRYIKPCRALGVAENESGEQISSLTRNLSGGRAGGTGSEWMVAVSGICLEVSSGESFRHLKSFQGPCGCCWWMEDSRRALRFASAAWRFDSARFRSSSVISISLGFSSLPLTEEKRESLKEQRLRRLWTCKILERWGTRQAVWSGLQLERVCLTQSW